MNVYGYEIPVHVIDGAMAFVRREPFTTAMLVGTIERLLPSGATSPKGFAGRYDIAYRGADRIVQRERRAGRLVAGGKMRGIQFWNWVEGVAA